MPCSVVKKETSNNFIISDELNEIIQKTAKKDKVLIEALSRKMKQIIDLDWNPLNHFKNLRHEMSDYKRVHINKSFVLLFEADRKQNIILFHTLKHHDEAYK